jgi:protease-4
MASKGVKIFGVILVVLLILFGAMVFALFRFTRPAEIKVRNDSVLELSIGGELTDLPPTSPLAQLTGQGKLSLFEMGQVLQAAAEDERISSLYCRIYPLQSSWGGVEELRSFMQRFRESGKKIYAYLSLELVNDRDLYLASAADEIHLNQDAALLVNGLVAEVSFYSKMMNKLKVRPDVLQFKEYKSPGNYTRSKMTPEVRSMYRSLLSDIQQRFKQALSRERRIAPQQLDRLMQNGIQSASSALTAGLVTHLGYEDQIRDRLKVEAPGGEPEYRSISASDYLRAVKRQDRPAGPHKVALLGGIGHITAGRSDETWDNFMGGDTMVSRLRKIRKDKSVKGLLFRVNSPGGSAVGSDKIWREIRLMEEAGKPVVVSMGGVAGSGGYYIAMGARKIVAQPSTVTGSIGVIFMKFNLSGLFDQWLGITVDRIKLAENADILSPMTSLNPRQRGEVEDWMSHIYNTFVEKAAEGRHLTVEEMEGQAGGRIFTGSQARQRQLIDAVGGLNTALELLKKELNIPPEEEVELVLYPKPKSLWQSLLSADWAQVSGTEPSLKSLLGERLSAMTHPAPWLIVPELRIH